MALIDGFKMQHIFPKHYADYMLKFSIEDEEALRKWTSNDQIISYNNNDRHGTKYAGTFLDESFLVLYETFNILNDVEEFKNIKNCISNCVNHYITDCLKFNVPKDCYFDISDSWIVRLTGDKNFSGQFRGHNHRNSFLTAVLFLQDSKNGLYLTDLNYTDMFFPFVFGLDTSEYTSAEVYIEAKKGRLVIFPSKILHSLYRSNDPEDIRFSIAMNIWPYGVISTDNSAKLSYNK